MRKHRLYGVSLAMLATTGGAVLSYSLISNPATTASAETGNGHINQTQPSALAAYLGHGDITKAHHANRAQRRVETKRAEQIRYYLAVRNSQIGQYLTAVTNFQQWINAAANAEAAQAIAQQAQAVQAANAAYAAQRATAQYYAQQAAAAQPAQQAQPASSYSSSSSASSYSGSSSAASAWQRVAICEEGGNNNPTMGYYGIQPATWQAYGGGQYSSTAGGASQSEQLAIAQQIQSTPPDQNGCTAW